MIHEESGNLDLMSPPKKSQRPIDSQNAPIEASIEANGGMMDPEHSENHFNDPQLNQEFGDRRFRAIVHTRPPIRRPFSLRRRACVHRRPPST